MTGNINTLLSFAHNSEGRRQLKYRKPLNAVEPMSLSEVLAKSRESLRVVELLSSRRVQGTKAFTGAIAKRRSKAVVTPSLGRAQSGERERIGLLIADVPVGVPPPIPMHCFTPGSMSSTVPGPVPRC